MTDETKQKETFKDIVATVKKSVTFVWKHEPKLLVIYLVILLVSASVVYLQLTSFSNIVNELIRIQANGADISRALIQQVVFLAVSFLIPSVFNNLETFYAQTLRNKLNVALNLHRVDVFSKLDIGTVEGTEFQNKLDFAQRWGIGSISNVFFGATRAFRDSVGLIVSAGILITINPLLALLAVIGGIPGYFTAKKYQVELFRAHHEQNEDSRMIDDRRSFFGSSKKLVETLLFGIKNLFRKQMANAYISHIGKITEINTRKVWAEFFEEFFNTLCLLGAIVFMVYETFQGRILIGSLVLTFGTYRSFVSTTNYFFYSLSQIEEHTRYASVWYELFEIQPKITNKPDAIIPDWQKSPAIELRNVSFAYPDTDTMVLKNISMAIKSGEKVAFVGLNGAGKTTLVKLISRVYEPIEGVITLDGVDIRDIDLEYLRENLAVLFQDFSNFQMTTREAIAIGRPNQPIDDTKVVWAADMSGAIDFIKEFKHGFNQLIWKGFKDGVELSKGQFQRMAVARIFYRDALISILDEPTASIDAVAEEKIFESLETKMGNKTVILISHRFSTVKNADKIAVIEHGELKEFGSHKQLMKKKSGRYAELYTMQASRYLESE
jgi:ABC-type multidrug transport system fused ATPase/permease subunit